MQHVFWLRPDRIAGRSGPNHGPWRPPRPGDFERALAVLLSPLALSAIAYDPFAIRVLTALEQD